MLRVSCDGSNINAEVTLNGKFKGECPVDIQITEGSYKLRAVKKTDDLYEQIFEQEIRIAAGTVKKVEVFLGEPQLTLEGRKEKERRIQLAKEETQRKADEAAAIERNRLLKMRADADTKVDALLAKARTGKQILPHCMDCPLSIKAGSAIKMKTPKFKDPELKQMTAQLLQQAEKYLANSGQDFMPPTESLNPPCDNIETKLRSYAGLDAQQDVPDGHLWYYRDLQFWITEADCKNGELSGVLDYWAFSVWVTASQDSIYATPSLHHIRANIVDGQPENGIYRMGRSGNTVSYHSDVDTMEMMSSQKYLREDISFGFDHTKSDSLAKSLTIHIIRHQDPKEKYLPQFSVITPLDRERIKHEGYDGSRLQSSSLSKNGKLHGEMILYEPNFYSFCYKNGKKIEMDPCEMD